MENKQLNKKVLIVDDDPIFLQGLMYTVKSLGYNVLTAHGGLEAVQVLGSEKVDIVLSDINMPNGNGLQLLNHVIKNHEIPVILMTGLSDLKEAQKALEMGARHFISKPFKKAEISEAISSSLNSEKDFTDVKTMIRIHLEEFIHGEELKYPLFIMKDDILVKVSNGGEKISPDTLASHRLDGLSSLYMKRSDFMSYVQFKGDFQAKEATRMAILAAGQACLDDFEYVREINPEAFERVSIQFLSCLEVLLENSQTTEILQKMIASKGFFKRSVNVGIISSLIGHYLGSLSTRKFFDMMVAGTFHEYGLIDHPLLENTLKLTELEPKDRTFLMNHPESAARQMAKLGLFSEEVLLMIEQHHEELPGTGYPHGLTTQFIHPLSKIITVGDAIAFRLDKINPTQEAVSQTVQEFTVESLGKHDLRSLEALNHLFKLSTPEEFVNYQLQDLLMNRELA